MRSRKTLITFTSLALILLPTFVFAQELSSEPSAFARFLGVAVSDGRLVALRIFQILWFVGFLAASTLSAYAFYRLRASGDDLMAAQRFQTLLIWAGGGAAASLLIFSLLSLAYWGIERTVSQKGSAPVSSQAGSATLATLASFSDFQKVTHVFPENNRRGVARNVTILIQFSESIRPESIVDGSGALITDALTLAKEGDKASIAASAEVSENNTRVTIRPKELLGNPQSLQWYTATITEKVLRAGGAPLFSDDSSYSWRFEVSGFSDNTPPFVESILPKPGEISAPNTLLLITFSEPVDPGSVNPQSIDVTDESGKSVPHTVVLGNGFRTAVIVPQEKCSTNACGDPIYCFPKSAKLTVTAKAAKLAVPKDTAHPNRANFPYTGIVDAAGNSFDGGGERGSKRNGSSEGSPTDDFRIPVQTGAQLDLTPPALYSINPGRDMTRIGTAAPLELQFTKLMDVSSIHSRTITLLPSVKLSVASAHDLSARRTKVIVTHDPFAANTLYTPSVSSDVRDVSQNCFSQCIGPTQ